MKKPYWVTIQARCPTENLRCFNDGDLTDAVRDILIYIERALHENGIQTKDRINVSFNNSGRRSPISEAMPDETTEVTFTIGRTLFDPEVIKHELLTVEMWPDFCFFVEQHNSFVKIDDKWSPDAT